MMKDTINKKEVRVGNIIEGVGGEEIITYIDRKKKEVYTRVLEDSGFVYNIEKDGSIKI